jgi:hypothetical protein
MTAAGDDALMVENWVGGVGVVLFLLVWAMAAKRLGLLQAGSRRWFTCWYFAVWGAVFMIFVYTFVFGFVPGIDGGYQIVVGLGAVGGALAGLMFAYAARRLPS